MISQLNLETVKMLYSAYLKNDKTLSIRNYLTTCVCSFAPHNDVMKVWIKKLMRLLLLKQTEIDKTKKEKTSSKIKQWWQY